MPVGIGHDRLAADFVEGDVLGAVPRGASDRHHRPHTSGIGCCPLQHLHAAHRAADHGQQPVNAQMLDQPLLGPHHVADGDQREVGAPGLAGLGIDLGRAGGAHAAAQHIGADDKEAVGVYRLAGSDHADPPAGLAGHRMVRCHELVAGQGMADQDRVALGRIQGAIGHIGDGERRQGLAAVQRQRRIKGHGQPGIGGRVLDRVREAGGFGHAKSLECRS